MNRSVADIFEAPARLVDCVRADSLDIPVGPRSFLHAGPPLDPADAAPPLESAIMGGLLLEGEASSAEEALALVRHGAVELSPCHHHGGVGALAGLVAPSTPVMIVERADGRRTFSPISESNVRALRFGQYDQQTLDHLRWLSEVLQPVLSDVLRQEPVDVIELLGTSLRHGDEAHNRCNAGGLELLRRLAPGIARRAPSSAVAAAILSELGDNPQFSLAVGMAAAKGATDNLHRDGPSGIITGASGNGTKFGIRVSGAGDEWITGPGITGSFCSLGEYSSSDANPIIGDSPVMEVMGLGALALTCAPALARRLEFADHEFSDLVASMRQICVNESAAFLIPAEGFRGSPMGLSVDQVAVTGIEPAFTIGYLHKDHGKGRVGVGIGRVPLDLVRTARTRLAATSSEVPA